MKIGFSASRHHFIRQPSWFFLDRVFTFRPTFGLFFLWSRREKKDQRYRASHWPVPAIQPGLHPIFAPLSLAFPKRIIAGPETRTLWKTRWFSTTPLAPHHHQPALHSPNSVVWPSGLRGCKRLSPNHTAVWFFFKFISLDRTRLNRVVWQFARALTYFDRNRAVDGE